MSDKHLRQVLGPQLDDIRQRGMYKRERQLEGPQGAAIRVGGREVINFCANNYLGLANHPEVIEAGLKGLRDYGAGTASVRFICGTFTPHETLELGYFPPEALPSPFVPIHTLRIEDAVGGGVPSVR